MPAGRLLPTHAVHQNHQAQEQFIPPCRHSNEQLTTNYYIIFIYPKLLCYTVYFSVSTLKATKPGVKFLVCENVLLTMILI